MPIKSFSHLSNFLATINREDGPILSNRFLFIMGGSPNVLRGGGPSNRPSQLKHQFKGNTFLRSMRYLCESVDIPGLSLSVDERPGYTPMARHQMPRDLEYGQLSTTFICRDWMSEKEYFDDWIFSIKNAHSGGAGPTFDNAYMVDYVIDGTILLLSVYNTPGDTDDPDEYAAIRYAIAVRNMYPVSIEPLNLNWSDETPLKVQVNFNYSYYEPILNMAQYANRDEMNSYAKAPTIRLTDLGTRPISDGTQNTPGR